MEEKLVRQSLKYWEKKCYTPDTIIIAASGFTIIETSIFQELMFVLRCSFCNNGTLASETRQQ